MGKQAEGRYIARSLEPVLKRAARQFPVVVLTGRRQSGKTTLLQHLFGKRYRYVSIEPPDVRAARGYVVHPGDVRLPLGPDATALPFSDL